MRGISHLCGEGQRAWYISRQLDRTCRSEKRIKVLLGRDHREERSREISTMELSRRVHAAAKEKERARSSVRRRRRSGHRLERRWNFKAISERILVRDER